MSLDMMLGAARARGNANEAMGIRILWKALLIFVLTL